METKFTELSDYISKINGSGALNFLAKASYLSADLYKIDGSVSAEIKQKYDAMSDSNEVYHNAMRDISNMLVWFMAERSLGKEREGKLVNHMKYLVDNHKKAIIEGAQSAADFCERHQGEDPEKLDYPHGPVHFTRCPKP